MTAASPWQRVRRRAAPPTVERGLRDLVRAAEAGGGHRLRDPGAAPNGHFLHALEESLRRRCCYAAGETAAPAAPIGCASPRRDAGPEEFAAAHVRAIASTPSTSSRPSSSAAPTSSRTPPRARSPRARRTATTRSSSTAASASARPICSTPSATSIQRAQSAAARALCRRRAVRERADQLDPLRAHAGLPRALPLDRRAAGRRHPVPGQQGAHAGGVLPHLQHALHQPETDHPLLRLAAAQHSDARGAPALPLRVGPDRRHPAARPRDQGRDPAPQGRRQRASPCPTTSRCSSRGR